MRMGHHEYAHSGPQGVGNAKLTENRLIATYAGPDMEYYVTFLLEPAVTGRFVTIQSSARSSVTLADVELIGFI